MVVTVKHLQLANDMQSKEEVLTQQAQQASVLAQHAQEEVGHRSTLSDPVALCHSRYCAIQMGKMQQIVAAEHEAVDSAKMEHEQEIDRANAEHQRELVVRARWMDGWRIACLTMQSN